MRSPESSGPSVTVSVSRWVPPRSRIRCSPRLRASSTARASVATGPSRPSGVEAATRPDQRSSPWGETWIAGSAATDGVGPASSRTSHNSPPAKSPGIRRVISPPFRTPAKLAARGG
ncbi:hypothetical protein [Azospirillum brasilense]|uniref:hypothetical protein n=1 Tax=Azospirillum brasilense TaxID=192 RepID=UPI001B3B925D|nr:hypothetical protein [Azospirillum brasilense]